MATQKLTIQLGLDGVGRVTGGLRAVAGVAQSSLACLSRLALPIVGLAATAIGLRSVASGLSEVIDEGGKLADISAATGVGIARLVRYRQVFSEAGKSADDVTPSFAKMEKAVYDAATQGGPAAEAISRLGLDIGKLSAMAPDQQFDAIGKAIGGIENPTQRAGLAMQVFGKSGLELIPVFDALANSDRTDRALGRLPEILERNAGALDAIGDGFGQLKLKSQQFFAGVLDQLAPTLDEIVQGFAGIDLTAAGQKAGAFVMVALDYWKAGKFDEFIGLTIEAGFELGVIAAKRVFAGLGEWMGSKAFWAPVGNGLLTAINEGTKLAAKALVSVVEGIAKGALHVMRAIAYLVVAEFNRISGQIEFILNLQVRAVNTILSALGKSIGQVELPRLDVDPSAMGRSTKAIEDASEASKRWLEGFFDDSTSAGRSLIGLAPSGDDLSAFNELSAKMAEMLATREATAQAEKKVADGLKPQVPIVNALADLRRQEAQAVGRLAELERQRAMIEGDFRLNDAQKYAQKLAILRQERAEIERIIALLQQRAAAPGLTEQEREQIGSRVDSFQGRLGSVNTAIGTAGADPNSVSDQVASSITGLENQFGTTAQAIARSFTSVIGTAVDSVSGGLQKLIGDTEYWSDRLGNIAGPIMGAVTAAISRMFTEWIAKRALMALKNMFWSVKEGAVDTAAKAPGAVLTSISSYGVAAAVGLAAVVAAVAAFGGFARGGYTGDMSANQVAGVVHGREYVFDAASVSRIGLDNLEAMRAGQGMGSAPGGTPASASPTQVTFAAFDSRQDARRWAESQDAEAWFVDMAKRTSNRWSRT
jgi:hypothetical protein